MRKMNFLIRMLSLLLVSAFVLTLAIPISAGTTGWRMSEDTKIFWVKTEDSEANYSDLVKQVQLFDSELAEKITGTALPISYGEESLADNNDIVLVLDGTLGIAAQGYQAASKGTQIRVYASDADGLFYGCRYVLEQLLINGSVTDTDGTDVPDVLERAVSLDCGRKYYTVDWIKELIREMSWADMNTLVLHFSEEMGLGIESKLYPWLAGRDGILCTQAEVTDDERYLTQKEIREIAVYAELYHVELVPSLDSPGHLNYLVKKFNEQCAAKDYSFTYNGKTYTAKAGSEIGNYYHYNGKTSIVKGSRNTEYSRGIDISNEVAVAFVQSLITEYANLFREFGCTKFDIGGDELLGWGSAIVSGVNKWQQLDHWKEYAQNRAKEEGLSNWANAVAYDGFMYYMNDLYDLVTALGYTSVRMWNDDALRANDTGWNKVVELNKNVEILFWTTGSNTVWTYANAGYKVHNFLSDYNYYAMTSDYFSDPRTSFTQAYADQIYNEWCPYVFDPNSTTLGTGKNTALGNPYVVGSAFAVWCDNPVLRTEAEVMEDLLPLIRAHGAKAWDSLVNKSVTYAVYTANAEKLGNAPVGTAEASDIVKVSKVNLEALMQEIESYNNNKVNEAQYTEETFKAYEYTAVTEYNALINSDYTQDDVDALVTKIQLSREQLRAVDKVSDINCIIQGSFKSSKVYVGKVATLSVSTDDACDVEYIEVYNDFGKRIEFLRFQQSTKKAGRVINAIFFSPTEEEAGNREYTAYAVFKDGTRSADSMTFRLTVKP